MKKVNKKNQEKTERGIKMKGTNFPLIKTYHIYHDDNDNKVILLREQTDFSGTK